MTLSQRLIQRVESLEREMREMKEHMAHEGGKSSRDFVGMFHNDQDFLKAMKLGRAWRRSSSRDSSRRRGRKK